MINFSEKMINLKEVIEQLQTLKGEKVTATVAYTNGFYKGATKHYLDGRTENVAKAYSVNLSGKFDIQVAENLAESKIIVGEKYFPLLSLNTEVEHQAGLASLNCNGRNVYSNPALYEYRGAYINAVEKVFDRESIKFMQNNIHSGKAATNVADMSTEQSR